jgi:hypothetical protein
MSTKSFVAMLCNLISCISFSADKPFVYFNEFILFPGAALNKEFSYVNYNIGYCHFKKERYVLNYQISYSKFPDKFWGLGKYAEKSNMENYSFRQFYFYSHLQRKILGHFFSDVCVSWLFRDIDL